MGEKQRYYPHFSYEELRQREFIKCLLQGQTKSVTDAGIEPASPEWRPVPQPRDQPLSAFCASTFLGMCFPERQMPFY